ncbi:ABC transporter permease subunit [Chitinimonas lacunae]|uniref:ABC transporter permease subunit n=1 Tax=Chitinimonas lacunae TaxID=1963018 RepID=A0ABV8MRS8_9NEIS
MMIAWLAGIRGKSLRVVSIIALCLISVAYLSSTFSGRHPQTVALDVGMSGARIVLALLAIFWVYELVGKELERKTIFFSLSYPVPRYYFWLGRFLGIFLLLLAAAAILAGAIYLMVYLSGLEYQQQFGISFGLSYLLVWLGVMLDVLTICAFALLMTSFATTPLIPIAASLIFMLVARSYGAVMAVMSNPASETADMASDFLPLLKTIAYVVPDLGALDFRSLILYGEPLVWSNASLFLGQSVLYACLALVISSVIFSRREFS